MKIAMISALTLLFLAGVCVADKGPAWRERTTQVGATFAPCVTETVVMVPMDDGVRLRTKIFLPDSIPVGGLPTMMTRTPYRFPDYDDMYEGDARFHVERGYAFALQDCRGRFDSEGIWVPYRNDFADAFETTEWIVSQSWSNGDVGTIGGSYDAFTALAAAVNNPHIKVVIADDAPEDERFCLYGGAPELGLLQWLYLLDHGDWPPDADVITCTNSLDVAGLDEFLLGRIDSFWRGFVEAEVPLGSFWDDISLYGRYGEICAPVLSVQSTQTSWMDPLNIWRGLVEEGCPAHSEDCRIYITPEGHCYHLGCLYYDEPTPVSRLMLDYIDKFLGGEDIDLSSVPPVQYYPPGEEESYDAEDWPPGDSDVVLYLHNVSDSIEWGTLEDSIPCFESPDTYIIDPAVMNPWTDYPFALYASATLAESLYLAGNPQVELYISASTQDADFFVFLYEYSDSFELVTTGQFRARYRDGFDTPSPLTPDEPVHISIEMFPTAHKFDVESQIMLFITGGVCGWAENPHTCEPLNAQTEWLSSIHRIYHDGGNPSHLVLPLAPSGVGIKGTLAEKPQSFSISAFPNPFNSSCIIAAPENAEIEIYDLRGNVAVNKGLQPLVHNTRIRTFIWQPDETIPSGVYLVRANAKSGQSTVKRIVYIR